MRTKMTMAANSDMAMGANVAACTAYCATITANCTTTNSQYADAASCLQECTTNYGWALGMMGDTSGNSVGCRAYHAGAAMSNAMVHCPHAGPTGGNVCGSWCENYCYLALRNCTGGNSIYPDIGTCMTTCGQIPTGGKPNDTSGNTVQCRIYHLGLAGMNAASAATHCPHGKVPSAVCM